MSLVKSRNWFSTTNLDTPPSSALKLRRTVKDSEGHTHDDVNYDLWEKNADVLYMDRKTREDIFATAKIFGPDGGVVFHLLTQSIQLYTVSYEINAIMMLNRYMDVHRTDSMKDAEASGMMFYAKEAWEKQDPNMIISARVLTHLCANSVTDRDLIVYRGFKDKRKNALEDEETRLSNVLHRLEAISRYESILREKLSNPRYMKDILSTGVLQEEYFNDINDYLDGYQMFDDISIAAGSLDSYIGSRDVDALIHGKGDYIETETFMSTSFSLQHARRFWDEEEQCCMLQIFIPKGTPCLYVTPFSSFQGDQSEFEILLPPCSRLIVTGRSQNITKIRYDGISDIAKQRMTLETPKMFTLGQMMEILEKGEDVALEIKNLKKHYEKALASLDFNNLGATEEELEETERFMKEKLEKKIYRIKSKEAKTLRKASIVKNMISSDVSFIKLCKSVKQGQYKSTRDSGNMLSYSDKVLKTDWNQNDSKRYDFNDFLDKAMRRERFS